MDNCKKIFILDQIDRIKKLRFVFSKLEAAYFGAASRTDITYRVIGYSPLLPEERNRLFTTCIASSFQCVVNQQLFELSFGEGHFEPIELLRQNDLMIPGVRLECPP